MQGKEAENEEYLKKETIKSKRLNDELNNTKQRLKESQEEYRKLTDSYRSRLRPVDRRVH